MFSDGIVPRELTTAAVGKAGDPRRGEYAGGRAENSGYGASEDGSSFAWLKKKEIEWRLGEL